MNSIEEKVKKFQESCYELATQEASSISKQIENEINESIKKSIEEYKQEMTQEYENQLIKIEHNYNSELFKLNNMVRYTIIEKKQILQENIVAKVKEKLENFTDSEEYFKFLQNNIKEAIEKLEIEKQDKIDIFLTKKDILRYKDQTKDQLKYQICEMDDSNIGGSICLNENKNISINNTLKESLNNISTNNQI